MLEKAELTLIKMLSKTRKNLQLLLPCFVVKLLETIIAQSEGFENLSLLFVPSQSGGMEIRMQNTIVELPIIIENIECVTECWTHNKMIIMKPSSFYEAWIASHYNLWAAKSEEPNYYWGFGDKDTYKPENYDNILIRKKISYFNITKEEIVDKIRAEIQEKYYVNIMIKPIIGSEWVHEVVVYGYNDIKKVFYAVGFEGHSFKKLEYSYEYFEEILEPMQKHLQERKRYGLDLAYQFQYPFGSFKMNSDFYEEGAVFAAYQKVKDELYGECSKRNKLLSLGTYETFQIYRGICCFDALKCLIDDMLKDNVSSTILVNSLKRFDEHSKMMLVSLKYMYKKWEKAMGAQMVDCIATYEECTKTIEAWKNIAMKYKITGQKELLRKIADNIPKIYIKEYEVLDEIVNRCIEWEKFNKIYI